MPAVRALKRVTAGHAEADGCPVYVVAVRELCEFTAKRGDLDRRFTPAPTAEEGIEGHAVVAARRAGTQASEVWLKSRYEQLVVRGRADGYDASRGRLEEVKTYKGDLARQPSAHRHLHWAQARIYAWLVCERDGLQAIDVALVYFDIGSKQETPLVEHCSAAMLRAFFVDQCRRFIAWAEQEVAHRAQRDAALREMQFVHPSLRAGQRQLAEAVYNAVRSGRCLLAEAPTGSGKTLGTLFPMLKAMPSRLDKVFYLTAKSSGRRLALDALRQLGARNPQLRLRIVELVARDKACVHPDRNCHGDSCPLAKGFYDRLPAARAAALAGVDGVDGVEGVEGDRRVAGGVLDQHTVQRHAADHAVCPYYLSQELVRWADVVVGDYNYWFDSSALLHALRLRNDWRVGLLVDEAHNLLERARDMYSAGLSHAVLQAAARAPAGGRSDPVQKALRGVRRQWTALTKAEPQRYQVLAQPPARLLGALQTFVAAVAAQQADAADSVGEDVLNACFAGLAVGDLAARLTPHSFIDLAIERSPPQAVLCVRNAVPAPFTGPRLQAAHASVLFSATLKPFAFYADMLGLPVGHVQREVESPFKPGQLDVHIAGHISTRYADRAATLASVAELMRDTFHKRPGNYLAYFSSYAYLDQAAAAFSTLAPEIATWRQEPRMNEAAQQCFVERFTERGQGIAFAVLGGAFAEGVDLPGSRLIGTFIATLGMPPATAVQEEMRRRTDAVVGSGFEYTYLYPGLRKVVQAAGRVVRTVTDQGSVVLMDGRFLHRQNRALLPHWWCIDRY